MPPRRTFKEWLKKYFCAGQIVDEKFNKEPDSPPPAGSSWVYANLIHRRPLVVGWFLPWCVVFSIWITVMAAGNLWFVFVEPTEAPGWQASVTMIFGSIVAGATSEGGGSVAFPVFTLIMGVSPSVARDFSLAIQSVGMTGASFTILYNRIRVSWITLTYANLGGMIGVFVGLAWISPALPAAYSKVIFVSIFFAFAINLFVLNMVRRRRTYLDIPDPQHVDRFILVVAGICGGILTAISGSGLDICTFAVLTLVFRVSEKVATPTSVVLMATNAILGFFYQASRGVIVSQTWIYLGACAAIVPLGAPSGAFISAFLHRQVLACFVYFTDTAQFILACVVLRSQLAASLGLVMTLVWCFVGALVFFFVLRLLGGRRAERLDEPGSGGALLGLDIIDTGGDENGVDFLGPKSIAENWNRTKVELPTGGGDGGGGGNRE